MCAARACLCMCGTFAVGGVLLPQARVRLARRVLVRPEPVLPAHDTAPSVRPVYVLPVAYLYVPNPCCPPATGRPSVPKPQPDAHTPRQSPIGPQTTARRTHAPSLAHWHPHAHIKHRTRPTHIARPPSRTHKRRPKSPPRAPARPPRLRLRGWRRQATPRLQCGTAPLAAKPRRGCSARLLRGLSRLSMGDLPSAGCAAKPCRGCSAALRLSPPRLFHFGSSVGFC